MQQNGSVDPMLVPKAFLARN